MQNQESRQENPTEKDSTLLYQTLGQYPDMSLNDARSEAEVFKRDLRQSVDPLIAKQRQKWTGIVSVDDLFEDWTFSNLRRNSDL